ncbi:MAG TPA: filamentous hemagglutinin N-terminal domain-containing protein [Verrucomicrobiae bacterium]
MKSLTKTRQSIWFAVLVFLAGRVPPVIANPAGLRVASGSAFAQQLGSQLNVTVSQTAVLNWSSFNLAAGETTSFLQPSANSVVLNVIGGANPSQIFGSLNANGTVILENANGFYFGPDSMIKVGGSFIATTAPLIPDFGSGSSWQFSGMPPLASIINYGQIQVGQGRSLFLIAENIQNHGSLTAPGGNIELAAGQSVLISDSPDGRGLSATVTLPSGSVDNFGRVTVDAGTIALEAKVVNQDGVLQANSVQNQNGVIELVASDTVNLGANSQIFAQGDNSASGSAGGKVTIKADNNFSDTTGSTIATAGGVNGVNGGNVEISAPNVQSLNSTMNASAAAGWTGGTFFLDPVNIILGTSTAGGAINVNTAFVGFSSIILQASGNITFNSGTAWNLSGSTGQTAGQLTLEAGGDIAFANNAKITDANAWSVTLEAGYNFGNHTINSGTGNIYLNGGSGKSQNGTIQLAAGSVNLYAGQSILVGSGSVFTTGGGSIFAYALAGDINAGTSNGGTSSTSQTTDYNFTDSGSTPNPFLGGISTAAGGNVTLIAGNNIDSTPKVPSKQAPGASGTYGFGNVTVIAGSQITGNYIVADGIGTMIAGVPVSSAQAASLQNPTANPTAYASTLGDLVTAVQSSQNVNGNIGAAPVGGKPSVSPVTFSVINGSWNVWAVNDISVKEVNNPNGAFNVAQSFLFNYAPDASASFWAGNAIELTGANLGRLTTVNKTPIYAPIISLNAGAGGIQIDKSIILAPSSQGSLNIITRDGGNLSGAVTAGSTVLNGITMSDSGSTDYTTYAAEHDNIHLHDANAQPVRLDISGSINSFSLTVPTFANITVHGDTYNFGFKGRNLSSDQTTSINVLGAITYRGNLTSETLSAPISAALFNSVIAGDPSASGYLRYDATTGTLTYVGVMSAGTETALLNPVDASGNPVALTAAQLADWQATITTLLAVSQTATLGDQGLALAGPGNFNVSANSIDLGISGGIRVIAPNAGLAAISPYGANLNVTTVGDFSMTSTKIANESYLGDVTLNVGGTLDVGGQFTTLGDPNAAKGIFTTSGGNVSVTANGDVNVNGSRIAAYDGGNLTVLSQTGDVNAGVGGAGYVSLTALELNPLTGQLVSIPASIPGSGILATTVVGSHAALGNILVETPNGNISASQGGVLQISFNGTDASRATAELLAGYELQDASGQLVSAQNLNLGTPVRISDNRNIDASGSGIIAQNVIVKATGKVDGLFVGFSSVNLDAGSFGTGIAFGPTVTISGPSDAGGIPIQVITDNPSTVNGVSVAPTASDAPSVPKEVAETTDAVSTIAKSSGDNDENDDPTKKKKGIALAQKVSRVTVLLPKRVSEKAGVGNPL